MTMPEPSPTKKPPPCKNNEQKLSLPWGRWENLSLCGTYRLLSTEALVTVVQARVEASASAIFPSGLWELSRSLQYAPPVVDRSVGRTVAQARVEASASAIFPSGLWELSRSLQYAPPVVDRSVGRTVAQARIKASASVIFPSGQWELLSTSTHYACCVPIDGAR